MPIAFDEPLYSAGALSADDPATDRIRLDRISAIDRSIIARAVREIATVQQRMANLSRYENPEDWGRPDPQPDADDWR